MIPLPGNSPQPVLRVNSRPDAHEQDWIMWRVPVRKLVSISGILLVVMGLVLASRSHAAEVTDLYQAQVPASGRSSVDQRQAMSDALRQVIIKVSGRTDLKEEQLRPMLTRADTFVQGYAFVGGARGEPLGMEVTFDAAAVNAGLQSSGLPVWLSNRPKVLLWLALEDAGGRRIASEEFDALLLDRIRTTARQRGLPVDLPLGDLQDAQALTAADLWAGVTDTVRAASVRYHPDVILVAKVHKPGALWQGQWQILGVGGTKAHGFSGQDPFSVIEPAVGWAIQDIASVYTDRPMSVGGRTPIVFHVDGIDTLDDYSAIRSYLKKLVVIRSVEVKEVGAGRLTLEIGSDTPVTTILQTLKADGRLLEAPHPGVDVLPSETAEEPGRIHEFEWHG